jgi:hypothetical protein
LTYEKDLLTTMAAARKTELDTCCGCWNKRMWVGVAISDADVMPAADIITIEAATDRRLRLLGMTFERTIIVGYYTS